MSHGGRSERVAFLREAIARIEAGQMPAARDCGDKPGHNAEGSTTAAKIRLGGAALDAALGGGLDRCGLHEIVAASPADAWAACGFALALAARFAAAAPGVGSACLWVLEDFAARETGAPYGPGLAAHGLDPDRLVLVRAAKLQDALWVMEEALRARALAAVIGEIWSVKDYGLAAARRLLLAARASRTSCILLEAGAAGKAALLSSAADTRLEVAARRSLAEAAADGLPLPGYPAWSVRLAKAKGSLGVDRERSFHLVFDPAERCLRDEPVSTLPLSVHRPARSADRPRPAAHEGSRHAAGA
jgi:protein ImuA